MAQAVFDVSKIKKILFLGPNGSYSDFAKDNFIDAFNLNCVSTNLKSISGIIKALKDENSEDIVAVIPIENSIDGIVRETIDNLPSLKKEGIKILAETTLDVKHALLGYGKIRDIKVIRSHTQALAQCKHFILSNFPDSIVEEATMSTSSAIKSLNIDKDKKNAAIGSVECAQMYGVPVIQDNINDEPNNKTRFILIGKHETLNTGKDKTSITFSTENKAGALSKILTILETYNLNMSYIDSRPSKKELGEYLFYIDFEGHISDEKVQMAFADLKPLVKMFYVIGSYCEV